MPSRGAADAIVVVRDADGRLRDLSWTPDSEVEGDARGGQLRRRSQRHQALDGARACAGRAGQCSLRPRSESARPSPDGFYYDFDVPRAFTPEDLEALEKRMRQIAKEGQLFRPSRL